MESTATRSVDAVPTIDPITHLARCHLCFMINAGAFSSPSNGTVLASNLDVMMPNFIKRGGNSTSTTIASFTSR